MSEFDSRRSPQLEGIDIMNIQKWVYKERVKEDDQVKLRWYIYVILTVICTSITYWMGAPWDALW